MIDPPGGCVKGGKKMSAQPRSRIRGANNCGNAGRSLWGRTNEVPPRRFQVIETRLQSKLQLQSYYKHKQMYNRYLTHAFHSQRDRLQNSRQYSQLFIRSHISFQKYSKKNNHDLNVQSKSILKVTRQFKDENTLCKLFNTKLK